MPRALTCHIGLSVSRVPRQHARSTRAFFGQWAPWLYRLYVVTIKLRHRGGAQGEEVDAKAKKRMQRWRARWGTQIGTVRLREDLPPGEAKSKVGHKIGVEKRDQNWAQKTRPEMRP